jgi:hypothetical protein
MPGFGSEATRSSQQTLQEFIDARIISNPNEVTGFTQEILDLLLFVLEKYAVFAPDDVEFAYSYLGNFMLSKVRNRFSESVKDSFRRPHALLTKSQRRISVIS